MLVSKETISIAEPEFFQSESYQKHLKERINDVCSKFGYPAPVDIQIVFDEKVLAFHNFKKIFLSPTTILQKGKGSWGLKEKMAAIEGFLIHQLGHIFFSGRKSVLSPRKKLFSVLYDHLHEAKIERKEKENLRKALRSEGMIAGEHSDELLRDILNAVEDGFVEKILLERGSDKVKEAVLQLRKWSYNHLVSQSKIHLLAAEEDDYDDSFHRIVRSIFFYSRFGKLYPIYQKENLLHLFKKEKKLLMEEVFPYVEKAISEKEVPTRELYAFMVYRLIQPIFEGSLSFQKEWIEDRCHRQRGQFFFDLTALELFHSEKEEIFKRTPLS